MVESNRDGSVQGTWLRFGLLVALLHGVFVLLVLALLQFDVALAVGVAVGVSIAGGIGITIVALSLR
ncbi:hypothetical protein [Natronorubrum sulfidifaciens]|uniref:Uncharacterized protein n=1 Tax=Natronorubrum sulfidifaciens JCM 14089 TaxID=1230460 RepID=L9W2Z2_9EURY|nr:hypothetical protein [Natronorubrum sulfidifaciens]ELY43651.1 hypothetical protein C495_12604 [Natronorubrum sulfidifaciens JCM 14089]